ncbi:MAG: hypothetical protein AAGE18_00990 [Pseudomonadota bacterium]
MTALWHGQHRRWGRLWALLLLFAALAPGMAMAGPWPRAVGETFAAFSVSRNLSPGSAFIGQTDFDAQKTSTGLFLEYGLTERWTIGAQGDLSRDDGSFTGSGAVFARRFLHRWENGVLIAAGASLGADVRPDRTDLSIAPFLTVGRGFESPLGNGWATADLSVEIGTATTAVFEGSATVGLNLGNRWLAFIDTFGEAPAMTELQLTIAPSVAVRVGERRHLAASVFTNVIGEAETGFRISLWQRF